MRPHPMELTALTPVTGPPPSAVEPSMRSPLRNTDDSLAKPGDRAKEQPRAADTTRVKPEQPTRVETAFTPHYVFEYEGKESIMKLQDSKGTLIYQIPSKGQLRVLQEADDPGRRVEVTA